MDCIALHENSKDGSYWANATNYLVYTVGYGDLYFKEMMFSLEDKDWRRVVRMIKSFKNNVKTAHLKVRSKQK
jgi:hypothetical protein